MWFSLLSPLPLSFIERDEKNDESLPLWLVNVNVGIGISGRHNALGSDGNDDKGLHSIIIFTRVVGIWWKATYVRVMG